MKHQRDERAIRILAEQWELPEEIIRECDETAAEASIAARLAWTDFFHALLDSPVGRYLARFVEWRKRSRK